MRRYASTQAWAFLLWRWRATAVERTQLKQRVRELEAAISGHHAEVRYADEWFRQDRDDRAAHEIVRIANLTLWATLRR